MSQKKIVATVLYRLDAWSLKLALLAALEWCDAVVVGVHEPGSVFSTDPGWNIIQSVAEDHPGRVRVCNFDGATWSEMEMRQILLDDARHNFKATHIAIVDADEAMTADQIPGFRDEVLGLLPGECIDVPMVSPWGELSRTRTDGNFGGAKITVAFADAPGLAWLNAADGYCYHNRKPKGAWTRTVLNCPATSGCFHLQYLTRERLACKAAYYKMIERVQFPDREESSPAALNAKYDWAIGPQSDGGTYRGLKDLPWRHPWIDDYRWAYPFGDGRKLVDVDAFPWQGWGCRAMLDVHGADPFMALDLHLDYWRDKTMGDNPVFYGSLMAGARGCGKRDE